MLPRRRHKKSTYRKIEHGEPGRGEAYPIQPIPRLDEFVYFGEGVGIYFLQLLILAVTILAAGFMMIPAMVAYTTNSYGLTDQDNYFLAVSAACAAQINVIATKSCPGNTPTCDATYAENCGLPINAAICDLVMSLAFLLLITLAFLLEGELIKRLDEEVQTAQDYSIEVSDPPKNANNPDEWERYFRQVRHAIARHGITYLAIPCTIVPFPR